ncbi:hypothetical protein GQ53DRAFT_329269 [Thozetella sp. PMI_491]|nr:hypothetical protein GQ53DRAFT_329269 [Thozetella sp. PMI_491]
MKLRARFVHSKSVKDYPDWVRGIPACGRYLSNQRRVLACMSKDTRAGRPRSPSRPAKGPARPVDAQPQLGIHGASVLSPRRIHRWAAIPPDAALRVNGRGMSIWIKRERKIEY